MKYKEKTINFLITLLLSEPHILRPKEKSFAYKTFFFVLKPYIMNCKDEGHT